MSSICISLIKILLSLTAILLPVVSHAVDVNGTGGTLFNYQVIVGGTPTSWAVTNGSLPPGLLLNTNTGVITGVPSGAGSYPATITATAAGGTTTPVGVTLIISASPGGSIQFSQAVFTHQEVPLLPPEPATTPTLTLTRTGGSTGEVTVSYTVYPSSITGNAVEGVNYNLWGNARKWVAAGRATWAAGDTANKTVPLHFLDTLNGNIFRQTLRYNTPGVDGTIRYEARLANLTGTATLGAQSQARFEVLDANAPAAGVLNYDARIFYGPEGSTATITVRRDGGSTGAASVNYNTSNTLPVIPFNMERLPSASAGQHYLATTGTLNWAAGDSAPKSFTVTLPATGTTAGTLQVGLYLTGPTGAVLGNSASAVLTIQNPLSTLFAFNDETVFGKYRVYVPPGTAPLRGTLFLLSGTGGDTRTEVILPEFQAVANLWRFALVGVDGTYSFDPGFNLDAEIRLGDLMDKIDLVANTTARPELRNAPIAFSGMSAGGYSASRSFLPWPERTIGVIAHNAWSAPIASYNPLTPLQREVPGLLMPGTSDTTVNLFNIGPALNTSRQYGQTRSAMAVKWGVGHSYLYREAYNGFAFYWFEQMMKAGRYPEGLTPTATTSPVLGSLALNSGWWGARNSTNTNSNGYQISGGSSRFLKIEADAANTLIKDPNNALVDSWLPTEGAARAYRAQASLQTIRFSAPLSFDERIIGVPTTLSLNLNSFGGSITSVEYFDGTTSLGSTSTSPYTLSWTPANSGLRGITAVATANSGLPFTAATYVFVPAPTIPFAPADLHTDNGNGQITLAWTAIANADSYNVSESSSAVGHFTLVQSGITTASYVRTGRTNGTSYFYKVTSTNSLGTSGDSRVVRATPSSTASLPIIQESFAYTVPTNAPDPDAGLNGNNGLPATNSGGNPSGTSTGLHGTWGTTTDVVAGLNYIQGTKTLTTTGGAGRINNADWGNGNPYIYRFMTTDPFLAQRIGAANNSNFGIDGTSLYISLLAQTNTTTADAFRFSFKFEGAANFFLSNTTTGWSLNGTIATGAALTLNNPTLMVVRFDFAEGPADRVSLWVNPPIGLPLGRPNATVQNISFPGFSNFQTRPTVANAMTFDEIRVGTSLAAVTPFTEPPLVPDITASQSATGTASFAFSYQVVASNTPTSYALASGSLPPGVTLNTANGLLSGTPTATGVYSPVFTATNALGTSPSVVVTLTISAGTLLSYEGFDYTASASITGLTGGTGWRTPVASFPWASGGTSGTVAASGLTYTGINAAYAAFAPTGRAGNYGGVLQNQRLLAIDTGGVYDTAGLRGSGNFIGGSTVTGTLWGSFLVGASIWDTDSGPQMVFNLSSTTGTGTQAGLRQTSAGSAISLTDQNGASIGATGTIATSSLSTTHPNLIVFRIQFNGASNDTMSVWLNPTAATDPANISATLADFVLNQPLFRSVNANGNLVHDEVRFGTTFAVVTPYTQPPATALTTFRTAQGLAANGSQDLLTPAGDGVANLIKYAFNMLGSGTGQAADLTTPNASMLAPDGTAGLPLVGVGTGPDAGKLQLTFIRRKAAASPAPGVTYAVEFSDALASWAVNGSATASVSSIDATFERVTVTDSVTAPAKRFARVRVTSTP